MVWSCHFYPSIFLSLCPPPFNAELCDPACSSLSSDNVKGISDNGPDQAARAGQFKGSIYGLSVFVHCPAAGFQADIRICLYYSRHIWDLWNTDTALLTKDYIFFEYKSKHKSSWNDCTGNKPHSTKNVLNALPTSLFEWWSLLKHIYLLWSLHVFIYLQMDISFLLSAVFAVQECHYFSQDVLDSVASES